MRFTCLTLPRVSILRLELRIVNCSPSMSSAVESPLSCMKTSSTRILTQPRKVQLQARPMIRLRVVKKTATTKMAFGRSLRSIAGRCWMVMISLKVSQLLTSLLSTKTPKKSYPSIATGKKGMIDSSSLTGLWSGSSYLGEGLMLLACHTLSVALLLHSLAPFVLF